MALRFTEIVLTAEADVIPGTVYEIALGLQGNDYIGGYYSDGYIGVGGSGDDRYVVGDVGALIILDAGGSANDRLEMPGVPLSSGSLVTGTVDGRHLILEYYQDPDLGPAATVVILDFQSALNRIESIHFSDRVLTFSQFYTELLAGDRYLGEFTWEYLTDGLWSSGAVNEAIGYYQQYSANLENTLPVYDYGEAGPDTFQGQTGNDSLHGGDGADMVSGGAGSDLLTGGLGDDYVAGEAGNDTLHGDDIYFMQIYGGQDWLWGGSGNDELHGAIAKDNLNGESGDDIIFGDEGNDRITGKDGNDTVHGGEGNDWVGVWNDWGEDPARNYFPESGDDQIFGDAGDDVLSAGFGADTADGGTGNDYVAGEQDNDSLSGGEGFDWLWAGTGADTLDGGAEKDNLNGEGGNDLIFAGAGNDRICGQQDNDTINAGDGNDWVGVWNDWGEDPLLNYFPEGGNDSINGDAGNDVLSAGFGTDTVHGGADDDYVAGEQDDDILYGDGGIDWLWGGSGADSLDGGAGVDRLIGEGGADRLTGGAGADFFVFLSLGDAGDRILDFSVTDGDRIDVSALLDEQSYAGADPFADGRLLRVQSGANVLLNFDSTLLATIENTTLAQLQNSVFIV